MSSVKAKHTKSPHMHVCPRCENSFGCWRSCVLTRIEAFGLMGLGRPCEACADLDHANKLDTPENHEVKL